MLTNIDLYEISLVNVPDNPSSTFVVAKSADGDPMILSHVMLDKTHFSSEGEAVEYLKSRKLQHEHIRDADSTWVCVQNERKFRAETFVRAKMNSGVFFVAGVTQDTSGPGQITWLQELTDVAKQAVASATLNSEENEMADTSLTKDDVKKAADKAVADAAAKTAEDAKKADAAKTAEAEKKTEQANALDQVAAATATAVVDGLKPTFEALTDTMKTLAEVTQKSAETLAVLAEPKAVKPDGDNTDETTETETGKTETAKTADLASVNDTLNQLATGLLAVSKQVEDVQKSATAVAKSTPVVEDRDEKIAIEKKAADEAADPNAVFNGSGLWPF